MGNVTWDSAAACCGEAKVITRRSGGTASSTVPATSAMPEPSVRRCSQVEPGSQSETLLCPPELAGQVSVGQGMPHAVRCAVDVGDIDVGRPVGHLLCL